jgi:serine protease inhibitor
MISDYSKNQPGIQKNQIFSPLSVYIALQMVVEGMDQQQDSFKEIYQQIPIIQDDL